MSDDTGWFRAIFALLLAAVMLPPFLLAYFSSRKCKCCYSVTVAIVLLITFALVFVQLFTIPGMSAENLTQLCELPPFGPVGAYGKTPDVFYRQFIDKVMCSEICPCDLDYF